MRKSLFWLLCLGLAVAVSQAWPNVTAQDITGGGSLVRDITGGAALIFRAPQNPTVHMTGGGQGTLGGGKIKPGRSAKPPVKQQDTIIARANAARSAPKPRYDEAEQYLNSCLSLREKAGDRLGMARAFNNLGLLCRSMRRFPAALEFHQKSMEIRRELGDDEGVARNALNLAWVHFEMESWEHAEELASRAERASQQLGSPRLRAKSNRAVRRRSDSATPVGDWCDGVTLITRISSGSRSTQRPSSSTGIATNCAPAAANAARTGG